ncbi:MAG: HEAT repeat domain-containing protein [Planctomycetota bacterium]|nr:HEAT repeat domain-containing protein [Planctomycetota bacterium]
MTGRSCCLVTLVLVCSCQVPQEKSLSEREATQNPARESELLPASARERVKALSLELLDKAEDERSLQLFFFEKMLRNPETEIRLRASRVAGRIRFKPGVPVLIEVGEQERTPQVLQEIAFALGQIGDGRAFGFLLKLAQDAESQEVRIRAVTALGRISGQDEQGVEVAQQAVDALIPLLQQETSFRLAREAALSVWRHGEAASRAIPALAERLHPGDAGLEKDPWPYAYALMKIDHGDTLEPLRRSLVHRSGLVRTYAAWGLRQPLDSQALDGLDGLLLDPNSPWTARVEALRTIGKMREKKWGRTGRARDVLLRHLIQEQHPLVAPVVVESLGMGTTDIELPFIIGSLDLQRSDAVRAAAVGALAGAARQGLLTRSRCAEIFIEFIRDPSPWFRVACATASASLGDEGFIALENYLQDPDRRVRSAAVSGLAQIDTPAVALQIRSALHDEDVSVRQAAVELAADRKLEGWQELLQQTWMRSLDDESWELRVKILGLLAETAAGKLLAKQSLEDPFRTVRTEAARVLGVAVVPRKGRSPAPRLVPEQLTGEGPPRVFLELEQGTMVIELDLEAAPRHVSDFIAGARQGIYDGRLFHRVVPSFVAQGGGPRRDGWGDEGWHLVDEIHPRTYRRGTVGMPKAGDDTGGSQIFITHLPTPHLDGRYTVFGQIVEGIDLLDQIVVGTPILRISVDENRFRRRVAF